MGEKNQKKEISLEFTQEHFTVTVEAIDALFHGKTPAYAKRFKSWATRTFGEHLDNLVNALLSNTAYTIATGSQQNVSDERLRGRVEGILLMREYIKTHASGTKEDSNTDPYAEDLADLIP